MTVANDIRRAWAPDSRMARVALTQGPANVEGRARVTDGVLASTPRTRWLEPKDYAGLDIVVRENFLSPAQGDRLLTIFDALHAATLGRKVGDDFWEGRIVYIGEVARHDPEGAAVMADFQRRTCAILGDVYKLTLPLWTDTVQLNIWNEGQSLTPHIDNSNRHGERHPSYWRDFSSVVYLNDDYEGGELYFTVEDAVLKPKRGMLVAFSAWPGHEHGVLKVTRGRRITMPAFYTFWPQKADTFIYPPTSQAPRAIAPGAAALRADATPRWTPPRV